MLKYGVEGRKAPQTLFTGDGKSAPRSLFGQFRLWAKMLEQLGGVSQPSNMSFSVQSAESGLEYNGTTLNHLFAQRRNLLRRSTSVTSSDEAPPNICAA